MQTLSWLFALSLILMAIVSAAATCWVLTARRVRSKALPTDWDITARAVFNTDERRVYRQLRDALPNHIVLAKLPLLRFSQAEDPQRMKYWYRVLGQLNVTFAICGVNGRLLAALDLDNGRTPSRRTLKIKQSVLAACRVRYMRLPVDHLPTIAELQLLVPRIGDGARASRARAAQAVGTARMPARTAQAARASTSFASSSFGPSSFSPSTFRDPSPHESTFSASTFGASPVPRSPPAAPPRQAPLPRPARTPLWQESSFFQDSFFGSDDRPDLSMPSDFGGFDSDLPPPALAASPRGAGPLGRAAGSRGAYGAPMPASRAIGPSRRPIRGRPRLHGAPGVSDTDIVGVVVDTHDAHRPAARRLLGSRDIDLD